LQLGETLVFLDEVAILELFLLSLPKLYVEGSNPFTRSWLKPSDDKDLDNLAAG
jgi:hypothetical protein